MSSPTLSLSVISSARHHLFLDMDEEQERIRDSVRENLFEEQRVRHIYTQNDRDTAAQLDEIRKSSRAEEVVLWQAGGSSRVLSECLRKENIRAEDCALQHRIEQRKQAEARLQELCARHRAEEAADQAAFEKRRKIMRKEQQQVTESSFRREMDLWRTRKKRQEDPDEMRRHQQTIKDKQRQQPSAFQGNERTQRGAQQQQQQQQQQPPWFPVHATTGSWLLIRAVCEKGFWS